MCILFPDIIVRHQWKIRKTNAKNNNLNISTRFISRLSSDESYMLVISIHSNTMLTSDYDSGFKINQRWLKVFSLIVNLKKKIKKYESERSITERLA